MNRKQLDALISFIDAKIAECAARDTSDGGLSESIRLSQLERELYESIKDED